VSDERYIAVAGALIEFQQDGKTVAESRSTARGAIHAEIEPGTYRVTLVRDGFGSKVVTVELGRGEPHQFRLLRDGLLGYMWPKWVTSGQRSEFRVHSVESYKLTLWRYGLEKEFVKMIGWFDEHGPRAVMQVSPDGDYTQTGIQWNKQGYGSPTHTQFVVAPERSGLYYLHAKTESGAFFSFPWIVAPASPTAEIAVLGSTNTWNAYNNFGGRSNYVNLAGLQPEPIVNARLEMRRYQEAGSFNEAQPLDEEYVPLSFDRPEPFNHIPEGTEVTDPISGRQGCHLAPAEWRLLGWLEREGYDYDLYSEAHLHDGTLDLDAYKILMISVHPEYWSREMFLKVRSWVFERGGRLMYLGGNGVNCEVEFVSDSAIRFFSHQPPNAGFFRYIDLDTGKEIDSRMHRRFESEASLLGVAMTASGIMTSAPYETKRPDHWVFAGTGLQEGELFGEECLHERCPGGASGHETDKMSDRSPAGTLLLAKGTNPDDGGAEMVIFETDGGGAVFSVGSITYPASLLVDRDVSRITSNVINAFLGERLPSA
jgi:hypothetical protein